jgi:hypothetical protein
MNYKRAKCCATCIYYEGYWPVWEYNNKEKVFKNGLCLLYDDLRHRDVEAKCHYVCDGYKSMHKTDNRTIVL